LTVPHALQVAPPGAGAGLSAAASNFCPQSWQNNDPSRLTFPH
jgi:hypothetical protein